MSDVRLDYKSLFSKWGFCDGDVLEWAWEEFDEFKEFEDEFEHDLLFYLAKNYLVTALPEPIELRRFYTNHNPARANEEDYDEEWKDFFVIVPHDNVMGLIRDGISQKEE